MTARDEGDMRVADYVLGLMEPNERAFFERDMHDDPALAEAVADWRMRVAEMDDTVLPVTRHEAMRRRIESGLSRPAGAVRRPPAGGSGRWDASPWRPLALGVAAALVICVIVAWLTL